MVKIVFHTFFSNYCRIYDPILLLVLYFFWQVVSENSSENFNGAMKSLSRRKRYLIFPEGSNLQLVYCLTIGAYGREGDLVIGSTASLAWELPNNVNTNATKSLHRQSRSVIFPKIAAFLDTIGLDGKTCVMKALCEAQQRNESKTGKGTFLQELFHVIFTLPNDGTKFESTKDQIYDDASRVRESCAQIYPTCTHSIYNLDF